MHDQGRASQDGVDLERFLTEDLPTVCKTIARFAIRKGVDPNDAIQETLRRALERITQFVGNDAMLRWCVGSGKLVCHELARERQRHVPCVEVGALVESVLRPAPDTADLVEEHRRRGEIADEVHAALATLTDRDRAILWAREIEDMSYSAIAEQWAMTEAAVTSALFRSRTQLRSVLRAAAAFASAPLVVIAAAAGWLGRRVTRLIPGTGTGTTVGQAAFISVLAVSVTFSPFGGSPLTPTPPAAAAPIQRPSVDSDDSSRVQPAPTTTTSSSSNDDVPQAQVPFVSAIPPSVSPSPSPNHICVRVPKDPTCLPPGSEPSDRDIESCTVHGPPPVGDAPPIQQDYVPVAEHVPDQPYAECEKEGNPHYVVSPSPPPSP